LAPSSTHWMASSTASRLFLKHQIKVAQLFAVFISKAALDLYYSLLDNIQKQASLQHNPALMEAFRHRFIGDSQYRSIGQPLGNQAQHVHFT